MGSASPIPGHSKGVRAPAVASGGGEGARSDGPEQMQNPQGPEQVAHVPGSVSPSADRSPEFQFKGWSLLFPADLGPCSQDTGAQERLLQRGQQLVRGPGPPSLLCANSLICTWLLLIFNQNKIVISFQSPGWRVKCGYSPNSHGWDSYFTKPTPGISKPGAKCVRTEQGRPLAPSTPHLEPCI